MFARWLDRILDRFLRPRIEAAVLRLSNRGDISVTVRHVTEAPRSGPCAACKGAGRVDPYRPGKLEVGDVTAGVAELFLMRSQGICLACRGRGSHTK